MPKREWARLNPKITPKEFEEHVRALVTSNGTGLKKFMVQSSREIDANDGTYEIDVSAEFSAVGGAAFLVLIECKRYKDAVKRDVVMLLNQKLMSTGAQKGIVFSTSGFQKGAITFAKNHGIALVKIADGRVTWLAKAEDEVPPPKDHPKIVMLWREAVASHSVVRPEFPEKLLGWLKEPAPARGGVDPADDPTDDYDAPEPAR